MLPKLKKVGETRETKSKMFTIDEYEVLLNAIGSEPKNARFLNFVRFSFTFSTRLQDAFNLTCKDVITALTDDSKSVNAVGVYSKK